MGWWIDPFLPTVGPKTVTVTGPSEAKVNDTVSLECSTTNSNPVARITWVLDGREMGRGLPLRPTVDGSRHPI
jgi:hypothetical protein